MFNIPKNTYRVEEDKELIETWIRYALDKLAINERRFPYLKYEDMFICIGKDDCDKVGRRFDRQVAVLVAEEFKRAGWICYIYHNYESECQRLDIYRREQPWSQYLDRV